MRQKGRIRRFLGCFRKTQKACIRQWLPQRRSSSYVPKRRSEAHVQSVAQEPRCMARGLGKGFTPAHIHSQLSSCSDQMAQAAGGIGWRKGPGGWSFVTVSKWLRQTRIRHSHELLCSANATSISCPGLLPAAQPCGMKSALRVPARTRTSWRQEQIYTGSHHRNIWVSICRNEDQWKTWKLLFAISCTILANKPVTLNCSTILNSILRVIQPQDREIHAHTYPWHKSGSKAVCMELFCYTDPGFPLLFSVPRTIFFVKSSSKDYMKWKEFCISLQGIFL